MYIGIHRKDPARTPIVLRRALILGLVMSLLTAGIALADNVQNDVTVGGTDTFTVGGSTTISYRIAANSGDGQTGCNASDGSAAVVTISTPAGVSATPNPVSFTACGTFLPTVFTATAAGNYVITVSVSDPGTGMYNTNPATFTLKVLAPSDTTPPVITPNVVGTLGDNDWYTSNVSVSWTVVDNESTISSSTGCDPTTINADTAGQPLTCSATSAAGTSSGSATIKRDATAPTISGSAFPAPNGAGWNNSNVTVSFTCADATSGVDSCGPNKTLSSDGAGQSATDTAVDNAGNSASTSVSGINIDKTAPVTSLVGGPQAGAAYYYGFVPAAPACTAEDALSGLASNCAVAGYGTGVGSHTVKASAVDKAGNEGSVEASYTVLAWTLNGFYRPVDMGGILNTVKGGSTVPLKFQVFAGSTELMITTAIKSLSSKQVSCVAGLGSDEVEELAPAGETMLRYDAIGGQFIYNWKTPKASGKCYEVTLTTQDGSTLKALFSLK